MKEVSCPKCTFPMIHKTTTIKGYSVYWYDCYFCSIQSPLVDKEHDTVELAIEWSKKARGEYIARNLR